MKVRITATGTSPLLMHNPQLVDPECEITRQIKAITDKQTKTDEDNAQIDKLEWYGGIYLAPNGAGGPIVVQPTRGLRKCLANAAKISRRGKSIERALSFMQVNVPLAYDGPKDIDELFADKRFTSRLPVAIGKNRVMRVRPQFYPWALAIDGLFIEDAGLNFDALQRIVEMSGLVEGLGDNRVNGYGRFVGKIIKVK
jgi:hypothetical protein